MTLHRFKSKRKVWICSCNIVFSMTKDTTQTDFKDVTRGGQAAVNNFLFAQT